MTFKSFLKETLAGTLTDNISYHRRKLAEVRRMKTKMNRGPGYLMDPAKIEKWDTLISKHNLMIKSYTAKRERVRSW